MPTSILKKLTASTIGIAAATAVMAPEANAAKARPNYSIQILADNQTVQAGGKATYPFIVRRTGGFRSSIRFRTFSLPAGTKPQIVPRGGNVYELWVYTSASMPASSTVSVLQGRSGNTSREALFRLNVNGPTAPPPTAPPPPPPTVPPTAPPVTQAPTFTLRADTPQATARTNETVAFGVTVDRSGGYTGPVELKVTGVPNGATAGFAPNPTVQSTNLYVTPGPGTPSGSFPLAITATAGGTVRFASVILVVQQQIDFGLTVQPAGVGIPAGRSAAFALDLSSVGGAPIPPVTFEISGLPANSTARFSANPANRRSTLTITTARNTPAGTYNVVITGRSGPFTHQASLQLFVTALPQAPGFGLSANPAAFNLARNSTTATTVTVSPTGGFSGPVAFGVSGLPTGLAWVANPAPGGAIVQFLAGPNANPGQYNVTVTGTSGTLSASITILINVV